MTDKLIKRLQQYYPVSTEVFGLLEKRCRMMELKKHDIIISADKTDDNIYIVQDGLLRSYYIDSKGNEVTQYFGMEGDLFTSMFSYYNREPAFLQVEAVTDMTLYAIRKKDIEALCSISIEAANWFRHVCLEQLYCLEETKESQFPPYTGEDGTEYMVSLYDVSGTGVAVGCFTDRPAYWKDNAWTVLPIENDQQTGVAFAISEDGSIIAGGLDHSSTNGTGMACYWEQENGEYKYHELPFPAKDDFETEWAYCHVMNILDNNTMYGRLMDSFGGAFALLIKWSRENDGWKYDSPRKTVWRTTERMPSPSALPTTS